jgi:hypothetical protein
MLFKRNNDNDQTSHLYTFYKYIYTRKAVITHFVYLNTLF